MPKTQTHYHIYKKVDIGGSSYKRDATTKKKVLIKNVRFVFKCMKPGCSHFQPHIKLLIGQLAECCHCNQPFIIGRRTLERTNLHCEDCTKKKNVVEDINEKTLEFLEKLEGINDEQ